MSENAGLQKEKNVQDKGVFRKLNKILALNNIIIAQTKRTNQKAYVKINSANKILFLSEENALEKDELKFTAAGGDL